MDDSTRLIAALRSPAAYDHPVSAVEAIETHISWVLLAGAFAYKIKKPVRLEFLDFSTLDKRRFFCEEELRLNRRLAPQLYLDAVPISGPPSAPRIRGGGEPIEWAVQMRRFPQESLLSQRLAQGRLAAEHIDRFARQAAAFHARIAVAAPEAPGGAWERVRQPLEQNIAELLAVTAPASPLYGRLRALQRWNAERLTALRETIEARRQAGMVRECHGDMHLANAVLLPSGKDGEEVVLFDGIEFNAAFRWIDVQNEIAFPVMDLEERGRRDLAWRFLNVYLEATGDYEGLAVLPLYLHYRALVRAKVDWIRGHQQGVSGEDRSRLEQEFERYLALAERYARPPHPRLFLTYGVSGSGKSHCAQRLVEEVGAVRMRSDVERKRLFGMLADDGSPAARTAPVAAPELYSSTATDKTYARLARLAEGAVEAGFSVVVDAAFLAHARREAFCRLAERRRVPWSILDLRASPDALRARIAARQRAGVDPSDADLEILAQQLAAREPLTDAERAHAIVIDTESPGSFAAALGALRGAASAAGS